MSLVKAYQNLSPKGKALVGIGLAAWGLGGLWATDRVEEKLNLTPSEEDKAQLDKLTPKVHFADRKQQS